MSKILNIYHPYDDKGNKHGYWEWYYGNGMLNSKGNYINGHPNGYWERYYRNGNLNAKGNYLKGKRKGYWEFYGSDGVIFRKSYTL